METLPQPREKFSLADIFKLVKEIPKNLEGNENKLRILLSGSNVGNVIEKLLFTNKDKKEVEQLALFVLDLEDQLRSLDEKSLNREFLQSEEFYFLFKRILEMVRFEYREEKLKLFRNFLLNSLRTDKQRIDPRYFINRIESLTLEHFEIIQWYYTNQYFRANTIGSDYDHKKKEELPKISEYHTQLENDLEVAGFLSLVQVDAYQAHRYLLSPTGKLFFEFVHYDEPL